MFLALRGWSCRESTIIVDARASRLAKTCAKLGWGEGVERGLGGGGGGSFGVSVVWRPAGVLVLVMVSLALMVQLVAAVAATDTVTGSHR